MDEKKRHLGTIVQNGEDLELQAPEEAESGDKIIVNPDPNRPETWPTHVSRSDLKEHQFLQEAANHAQTKVTALRERAEKLRLEAALVDRQADDAQQEFLRRQAENNTFASILTQRYFLGPERLLDPLTAEIKSPQKKN